MNTPLTTKHTLKPKCTCVMCIHPQRNQRDEPTESSGTLSSDREYEQQMLQDGYRAREGPVSEKTRSQLARHHLERPLQDIMKYQNERFGPEVELMDRHPEMTRSEIAHLQYNLDRQDLIRERDELRRQTAERKLKEREQGTANETKQRCVVTADKREHKQGCARCFEESLSQRGQCRYNDGETSMQERPRWRQHDFPQHYAAEDQQSLFVLTQNNSGSSVEVYVSSRQNPFQNNSFYY